MAQDDSPTGRISILIVEDEAPIRRMLESVFEAEGYTVRSVADGETALLALAESLPDVVVLDLGLPRLNGAEVLRRVRADGLDVAVIVVSATLDGSAIASAVGADGYLAKSFDVDELVRRVLSLAGRGRGDCSQHGQPDRT